MQSAKIHDLTRGTHCSALADTGKIIASREDIGRHNTIDMLGGYCLLNGIDCADKVLLTTGRVSSEIIVKACRIGAPLIISHSAATSRAVILAGEMGITLVGYVRGGRFKIYAGGHRIATRAGRKKAN
jgi:FdhD protein